MNVFVKYFAGCGLIVPKFTEIATTALPFYSVTQQGLYICVIFNCCLDSECNEFIAQHVEFLLFKMAQCSQQQQHQSMHTTTVVNGEKNSWHHRLYIALCIRSSYSVNDWCWYYSINICVYPPHIYCPLCALLVYVFYA